MTFAEFVDTLAQDGYTVEIWRRDEFDGDQLRDEFPALYELPGDTLVVLTERDGRDDDEPFWFWPEPPLSVPVWECALEQVTGGCAP